MSQEHTLKQNDTCENSVISAVTGIPRFKHQLSKQPDNVGRRGSRLVSHCWHKGFSSIFYADKNIEVIKQKLCEKTSLTWWEHARGKDVK